MAMTNEVTNATMQEIRNAVTDCSERGLMAAAKWTTDILLSMGPAKRAALHKDSLNATHLRNDDLSTSTPFRNAPSTLPSFPPAVVDPNDLTRPSLGPKLVGKHAKAPKPISLTPDEVRLEQEHQERDRNVVIGAKAFFDAREYSRVAYMLRDSFSLKAVFLRVYSAFLASERQALIDWHKLDSHRNQPASPVNDSLNGLLAQVINSKDAWCLFLKALFLSRLSRREEAIEAALQSIANYPWNWSTWTLLCNCINDADELNALLPLVPLPSSHPLVQFFLIKAANELQNSAETELAMCDRLLSDNYFPLSLWTMSQRACVLYQIHEYIQAEAQFDRILKCDPHRIDDIDIFSNILYIQDNKLKLSKLAQDFLAVDKDRPEVCCLVGNHYSLRQEHDRAVKYFRRATQLDRTYLTAWTLMGHEYVEMKNSHAAIEAYRRAVDVNRKDYRAWYGLGQAYELLSMHHYAIYYYQHATALKPYDVRLWQATGLAYEEMGRPREAIDCYKRALISSESHESTLCLKLARLHRLLKEEGEAVAYHKRVVELCQFDNRPIHEYAKSSLEVADYHMKIPHGDLLLAQEYLQRVAVSNAEDVTRATEMLKTVKTRLEQQAAESNIHNTPVGAEMSMAE